MSSYTALRDALETRLDTVANVGQTHNRERYTSNWSDFLAMMTATIGGQKQVRGWWVSRDGFTDEPSDFGNINRVHQFVVRGVQSLNDGDNTETTFQNLVEEVAAAVANDDALAVAAVGEWDVGPARVTMDTRMFGSVLCHYAEIQVPVQEVLSA
jgi:hypothetical protein